MSKESIQWYGYVDGYRIKVKGDKVQVNKDGIVIKKGFTSLDAAIRFVQDRIGAR